MNNYEEIIEQIHESNMHKRESEQNLAPSRTHQLWIKMALAASLACVVCLSVFIIGNPNNQPQPFEIARIEDPDQFENMCQPDVKPSEPQATTSMRSNPKDDKLIVVCQNDCDVEDVLQRFEQTLSTLN
ncbi:MAG: hypothetical protein MJZ62_04090 [Bacteroidales bacterium]|nr:hypothetical protein [Bacteroidales bacterium]